MNNGTEILNTSEEVSVNRTSNISVEASFSNNIGISVMFSNELLQFSLDLDPDFANNVSGILGNFNGDNSDDYILRNGSVLGSTPSDMEIHTFGQSCKCDHLVELSFLSFMISL